MRRHLNVAMLRPSPLHRVFRVEPGLAPRWVVSSSCEGGDAFVWVEVLLILGAIFVWQHSHVASLALVTATLAFAALLHLPFERVERFARARRRRRECIFCGRKLESGEICAACDSSGRTT